jgi:photosystem II PsbZ protein
MIGIVQVFVFLLIIVSFAMVVGVPVILATPGEWEKSQSIVWSGAGLWSALVLLTILCDFSHSPGVARITGTPTTIAKDTIIRRKTNT